MPPELTRLLQSGSPATAGEVFIPLLQRDGLLLEQIVSHGQGSPEGFWYDQPGSEWVALLSGSARLQFEDGEQQLGVGDALLIPAHCRHRVAECSADAIWLALHLEP